MTPMEKRFNAPDYERIAMELENLADLIHPRMTYEASERLRVIARQMRNDTKSDVLMTPYAMSLRSDGIDMDIDNAMTCRHRRADHIRVTASGMQNQESRHTMFRLAENYERMADTIEAAVIPPAHRV